MKLAAVAALMLLVGSTVFPNTTAMAQGVDWGLKSALLEEEMTEAQVMRAVGYRPNKVSLETCGSQSQHGSWSCKILMFGGLNQNLKVLFRKAETTWIVNSWFVEP